MKKSFRCRPFSAAKPTPAQLLYYSTSFILTVMFAAGIILIMLPEHRIAPEIAAEFASDLLQASFRVAALGAIFITLAAALSARYPDSDK